MATGDPYRAFMELGKALAEVAARAPGSPEHLAARRAAAAAWPADIVELAANAPPLSAEQRANIQRLLGGELAAAPR